MVRAPWVVTLAMLTCAAAGAAQNQHATRLVLAPTGRTLDRGQGYAAGTLLMGWVPMAAAAVGLTDRVTLAGGSPFVNPVDPFHPVYFVAPKVGVVRSSAVNVAVGAVQLGVLGAGWVARAGYVAVTAGTPDHALTVLAGAVNDGGRWHRGVVFGGETRIGKQAKVVGEVWSVPPFDELPALVGVRIADGRWAYEFGVLRALRGWSADLPAYPWVSAAYSW